MKFLRNTSTDPHFNMSFDELCLSQPPSSDTFFYLWRNSPAVIVGLNQNVQAEVNLPYLEERGIALARRVTGGGAVYHDLNNLNYTIIGRPTAIHAIGGPAIIARALQQMGVAAELGGRNDIFVDGRKVSGYAKRFEGDRVMIHGTLMFDVDLDTLAHALDAPQSKLHLKGVASVRSRVANLKDYLPYSTVEDFASALHRILAAEDSGIALPAGFTDSVQHLAGTRFSTSEWIYGKVSGAGSDEL